MEQTRFCIVGLGLIGGSFAKALRRSGARHITAVDLSEETLRQAEKDGCIDEGSTEGSRLLAEADIVILALYEDSMKDFVRTHREDFRPGTVLTDVTGIKGSTPEEIQRMLPDGVEFLAGHPMAGREGSGYGQSAAEIFDGANYILVPHEQNRRETTEKMETLARQLG